MEQITITKFKNYDLLGIILSAICGVHCLITPIAILYAPSIGQYFDSTWVHTLLIEFVTVTFYQSVYLHYKLHRSKITLGSGLLGFVFLLLTYFVEVFSHSHDHEHGNGHEVGHNETNLMVYLAVIGAVLLVTSHILNIKKYKCLKGNGTCLKV